MSGPVTKACNPKMSDAEAEYRKLEASLGHTMRPFFKIIVIIK